MEEIIMAGTVAKVVHDDDAGAAASEVRRLEERMRELERLLGRHGGRDPRGGARSGAGIVPTMLSRSPLALSIKHANRASAEHLLGGHSR